jgi:hypothetical protein
MSNALKNFLQPFSSLLIEHALLLCVKANHRMSLNRNFKRIHFVENFPSLT